MPLLNEKESEDVGLLDREEVLHKARRYWLIRRSQDVFLAVVALLFLWPLTLPFLPPMCSAVAVCCAATVAAMQEGRLIRAGREPV